MNPYDEFAVEEALQIKERLGSGEITVLSLRHYAAQKPEEASADLPGHGGGQSRAAKRSGVRGR